MKKYIIAIVVGALPICGIAQQSADSTNVLDDVTVKESFESGFIEEKLPLDLAVDLSEVVQISERVHWSSIDATNLQSTERAKLDLRLASPQLVNIRPAPVKIFTVKFSNLERWKLDITASDGSLFRSISGIGNPPAQVSWDGIGDNGEHLIPGHNYAYSFIATDKAGNKKTFLGQSFTVPAFYLNHNNKLCVGIDNAHLFGSDGLRMKPEAQQFAREVAALVRYFSTTSNVQVRGRSVNTREFFDLILNDLITDESLFTSAETAGSKGDYLVFYIE
jgi:hypothetical protein